MSRHSHLANASYESAVQGLEQEKKMVAALKRLSIGNMMTYDPDLPMEDEYQAEYQAQSTSNTGPSSSGTSTPAKRRSMLSIHSATTADTDEFFDAEDNDEIFDTSGLPLLWVPANLHPEVDPDRFKMHVKTTVEDIMERKLSKKSSLSSKSSLSRDDTDITDDTTDDNNDDDNTDTVRSSSTKSQSSTRLHSPGKSPDKYDKARYSNPSLRELTSELEKLSRMAGMDATDAVTLARTLSGTSLGYTDVEKLAMDEIASPHTSPRGKTDIDDDGEGSPEQSRTLRLQERLQRQFQRAAEGHTADEDSDEENGSPVRRGSRPRKSSLLRENRADTENEGELTKSNSILSDHRSESSVEEHRAKLESSFGYSENPLRNTIALKRSRRPDYRKQGGKLAELRTNLAESFGESVPRKPRHARDSQLLFSYRNPNDERPKNEAPLWEDLENTYGESKEESDNRQESDDRQETDNRHYDDRILPQRDVEDVRHVPQWEQNLQQSSRNVQGDNQVQSEHAYKVPGDSHALPVGNLPVGALPDTPRERSRSDRKDHADPRFTYGNDYRPSGPSNGASDPRLSGPRQSDPRQPGHRQPDPRQLGPRQSDPRQPGPRQSDPRKPGPRQSDPRQSGPRLSDRQSDPNYRQHSDPYREDKQRRHTPRQHPAHHSQQGAQNLQQVPGAPIPGQYGPSGPMPQQGPPYQPQYQPAPRHKEQPPYQESLKHKEKKPDGWKERVPGARQERKVSPSTMQDSPYALASTNLSAKRATQMKSTKARIDNPFVYPSDDRANSRHRDKRRERTRERGDPRYKEHDRRYGGDPRYGERTGGDPRYGERDMRDPRYGERDMRDPRYGDSRHRERRESHRDGRDARDVAREARIRTSPQKKLHQPYVPSMKNKSAQLNQNLDMLRSEINEFKESLNSDSKEKAAAHYTFKQTPDENVETPYNFKRATDENVDSDFSFELSYLDLTVEDPLGIENEVLGELNASDMDLDKTVEEDANTKQLHSTQQIEHPQHDYKHTDRADWPQTEQFVEHESTQERTPQPDKRADQSVGNMGSEMRDIRARESHENKGEVRENRENHKGRENRDIRESHKDRENRDIRDNRESRDREKRDREKRDRENRNVHESDAHRVHDGRGHGGVSDQKMHGADFGSHDKHGFGLVQKEATQKDAMQKTDKLDQKQSMKPIHKDTIQTLKEATPKTLQKEAMATRQDSHHDQEAYLKGQAATGTDFTSSGEKMDSHSKDKNKWNNSHIMRGTGNDANNNLDYLLRDSDANHDMDYPSPTLTDEHKNGTDGEEVDIDDAESVESQGDGHGVGEDTKDIHLIDLHKDVHLSDLHKDVHLSDLHKDVHLSDLQHSSKMRDSTESPSSSPTKVRKKKSFGLLQNNTEGKKLKKKKSWPWLKERSSSLSLADTSNLPTVPESPSRLVLSPEFQHEAAAAAREAEKGVGKENRIAKLFKKKKSTTAVTAAAAAMSTAEGVTVEHKKKGLFKKKSRAKMAESLSPALSATNSPILTDLPKSRDSREEPTVPVIATEPSEEPVFNPYRQTQEEVMEKQQEVPEIVMEEPKEDSVDEATVEVAENDADDKPQTTQDVQEKLKKVIKRSSRANQPIEFTDSAFGFPLPPPSHSTLVMLDYRFPVHVERAIYRLSHLKLANPKRSLREQVLLSNFMYAYLNLVDHTLHLEQQMNSVDEDANEDEELFTGDGGYEEEDDLERQVDTLEDELNSGISIDLEMEQAMA